MGDKRLRVIELTALLFLAMFATLPAGCFSAANHPPLNKKRSATRVGSSVVFPVQGNLYPLGYEFLILRLILGNLLMIMVL